MQHNKPHHTFTIQFKTAGQTGAGPGLAAGFGYAPAQPEPGQPGKEPGNLIVVQQPDGAIRVNVSLGNAEKRSAESFRKAGGGLGKWLMETGPDKIDIDLDAINAFDIQGGAEALLEGIKLGAYAFKRYKNSETPGRGTTVWLRGSSDLPAYQALAEQVEAVANAVILARDLGHEPANVINPLSLADRARAVAQSNGLAYHELDEEALAEAGAGAILAVGMGSQTPPRLMVLEYAGTGADSGERPVVLVGKAITFDTGGYSIKDRENIVGMKYDKCGGVTVLAILQAASALGLKTPVVGIIGAAENMISAKAYRPDDIITTMNGKTVEIISTDAEGRLVLADALAYAQKNYQPRALIDLATLTGGVVVALGRVRAGLLANDDVLADRLFAAGEKTYERLWRMPLDEEYSKNIKGDDADLKNSGGREGHCILGGAFLQAFIEPGVPWAHLDIAGVADTPKELPYSPKGATGFGVRLIVEYLRGLES